MAMPLPSQPRPEELYKVLGVDINATAEEVGRAYRQKARETHPDKKSGTSIDDWHLLNKAYSTLTDNIKRREYNEQLASADTEEKAPDYSLPTLPSTDLYSTIFRNYFKQWLNFRTQRQWITLHRSNSRGSSFTKAFCPKLRQMLNECSFETQKQESNKHASVKARKRGIIAECDFESTMKAIAGSVDMPSPVIQEVSVNLLRIIREAQKSTTPSAVLGNSVSILDLSATPANDLWLLLHLFTNRDVTHQADPMRKEHIEKCLIKYIPHTNVQEGMLKKEHDSKCGKCGHRIHSSSRPSNMCASCTKGFCRKCLINSMKAPRIGINIPQPICQSCTNKLAQKDAEDWIAKAQHILGSREADSQKAAMACVLMALHTSEELPSSQMRAIARELNGQGYPEQSLFILSLMLEEANSDKVKLNLPAAKALQGIAGKQGKQWKEKWLLTLMAQQAALLAVQSSILSDRAIDIPDMTSKHQQIVSSIAAIECEKEEQYKKMVKDCLGKLEKAWGCRDMTEMLNVATDTVHTNEDVLIVRNGIEPAVEALCAFLDARKAFLSKMMPSDQYALYFFQGYADICNGNIQKGLDSIEIAIWSGYCNRWISKAAMPIVVSQLMKHPSIKNDITKLCNEIIQNGPSQPITFGCLPSIIGIVQEDLNPSLKRCWPDMYVPGINQAATGKYEMKVHQQVKDGQFDNCDAGYALIDYFPAANHPSEAMVCFLNASLWFLRDLRVKKTTSPQHVYALKMLTLKCVEHAYVIAQLGLHPGMQFYMARFGLAIASEAIVASGKCATEDDTELIVNLFQMVIQKGRFCPFWKLPIVPVCEAFLLNIFTGRLHTEFMLELQENERNHLLQDAEVKYQLYENDLRWVCPVKDKDATCARAMEALLKTKGLSWSDISDSMCSPLNPRSQGGWLLQKNHLGGNLEFAEMKGFSMNIDVDSPSIKLTIVPASTQGKRGMFSANDVHTVLQIPSKDRFPIIFSLDPPNTTQRFHPFQQLRFSPSSLETTELLHTLLHTDYLLKCFSVGSDVSTKPPFMQRHSSEGLTANLPPHLKRILTPVSQRGLCTNKISRFWIQADEVEYSVKQDGSQFQCQIGAVKMAVRTQPQVPGLDGKLNDTKDEDPDSPESKFAKDLTDNYNEISKYFPMFARLRELCKLQVFGAILGHILDDIQSKANGEGVKISAELLRHIQSKARRENEARIQQMLTEIKQKIGEWPSAENTEMYLSMVQCVTDHVRSEYGSSELHRDEVRREISAAARKILREKDESCINQLTQQLREALSGKSYRGNLHQCVNSWLRYGSHDLKNLILSTMPVPTEHDIKQVFVAENRKLFNCFNLLVNNISSRKTHVPRRSCTWVPAAVNIEESEDGQSMRMCYGGVVLAPTLKQTVPERWDRNEVINYDLNQLRSSYRSTSAAQYPTYTAPAGLTTPKNRDIDVPGNFLPSLKPIRLHSDTLVVMELSMQTAHSNVVPLLTKILATVNGGSHTKGGGGFRGAYGGVGGGKRSGANGGGSNGGGDGGRGNRRDKITALLLSFGLFQGIYKREREKYEPGRRDHIRGATAEAQRQAEEKLPRTDALRDEGRQQKFRRESEKKGIDISDKHVAHIVGLDVVRYILIKVDGKTLTDHDINLVKGCCNKVENFELVPARENQSDHKKKDNAFKKAISEYLKEGRVSGSTWAELDLTRVGKAVKILKSDDWPAAISQRVQVLRQICNPQDSAQNLWDIA